VWWLFTRHEEQQEYKTHDSTEKHRARDVAASGVTVQPRAYANISLEKWKDICHTQKRANHGNKSKRSDVSG
jgi:hypothetical protein